MPKTLREAEFASASFDIVTMFHVIEHVPSPSALLLDVYNVLRKSGLVVIETPKIGFWFKLLRKRWRQFIPGHYWFFNEITLSRLLEKYNFEILEIKSIGKSISVRFLLNRLERLVGEPIKVISKITRFLKLEDKRVYINPGDIMLAIARKK